MKYVHTSNLLLLLLLRVLLWQWQGNTRF